VANTKSSTVMVAPRIKRQTVGLKTSRLGSVKGQEVCSSIPRADRFWTHPVSLQDYQELHPPDKVPQMGDQPPASICCRSHERVAFHISPFCVHIVRSSYARGYFICNLFYIAHLHTRLTNTIVQFCAITAHFRTRNTL
jgi:hypothetical protein